MSKEEIERLAKFIELLAEIDRKNKVVVSPTSHNPNSRN